MPGKNPPQKKKTPAHAVAEAMVKAYSDPDWPAQEAQAQAEKEAKMRAALVAAGALKKGGAAK